MASTADPLEKIMKTYPVQHSDWIFLVARASRGFDGAELSAAGGTKRYLTRAGFARKSVDEGRRTVALIAEGNTIEHATPPGALECKAESSLVCGV